MRLRHTAIVMPAYDEADGIGGFIDEVVAAVAPHTDRLSVVVVDDASGDGTAALLRAKSEGDDRLVVVASPVNRGHGPTALRAYREGIARAPDVLVHVDGDGQFSGDDIARVALALVGTGADAVHGVRRGRDDPWFRRLITAGISGAVAIVSGRRIPDVNTPLRAYRPQVAEQLVRSIPEGAAVPHIHFSLIERRSGLSVRYVEVASLPRRGSTADGTMFGAAKVRMLPPASLLRFVGAALAEVWRESLRPGAGERVVGGPPR